MRPAKQPGSRHRRLDEEPLRAQHERRDSVRQLLCEAANTTGADDQTFSAKWITDLEASYRLEQVTFGVGVQNLFDVYPEQVLPVAAAGRALLDDQYVGINGRFLYARASMKF